MLNCSRPIGRQSASGLSLLLAAFRTRFSSAAQGWNGSPSLKPAPTSKKVASGGVPGGTSEGDAPREVAARTHSPERSGLPSDVRGAGAFSIGLPALSLGTPGVG